MVEDCRKEEEGVEKRTSATDWYGPDDDGNPHNWSTGQKVFHTIVPPAVGFLWYASVPPSLRHTFKTVNATDKYSPFGSSVYTPGHEQVMVRFGVSEEIALLPFALYLLGLSFGPVIAAPTSETFGRRIVYLSALPIFAAFTLGASFAQSITSLIVCRFFAGLFSSPGLSIGTGTISDLWPPEHRGAPMSVFITSVQMGPALGPVIGGFVTAGESWRWTQWVILMGIGIVFVITLCMKETYKKTILQQRAKALDIPGPPVPDRTLWQTVRFFAVKTITRPLHMLFTEPIVALYDLYVGFNFGLLNAFFAAYSWVFETVYGFGIRQTGLTYLGQAVGSFVGFGILLFTYRVYWTRQAQLAKPSKMAPEKRLVVAMVGAPMLPLSLFWFGWTARSDIHWISPVIAEGFFACGNLLVFTCASLYLTDCYGALYGASAWSSNTFLRYLFAFAFPLFALQMYRELGIGWASSLLGFVSVLLMPVPFLFWRYGERLRGKTNYPAGE